ILLSFYPNILIRGYNEDGSMCDGNPEQLGDFSKKLSLNSVFLNLVTAYLMSSSFENKNHDPDFEFNDFCNEAKHSLLFLIPSKNLITDIVHTLYKERVCLEFDTFYHDFNRIHNILFEEYCIHKAQEYSGISWDAIGSAKMAAKEMLDRPEDQLLSVLKFICGKSIERNREDPSLDLDDNSMGMVG
ncbi:MAG TPA: hypothetical protein VIY47_03765, partial [Ignavibacteriaceae bacterium]